MLSETILPGRIIVRAVLCLTMTLCPLLSRAQDNVLRVSLVQGLTRDEIVIHFTPGATNGFDNDADAWKICNGTFDIFSLLADGSKLSINSLPLLDSETVVQLGVDPLAFGDYQIEFAGPESFPDSVSIVLHDLFISKLVNVRANETYLFTVNQDPASSGSRFELIFSNQDPVTGQNLGHSTVITQVQETSHESFLVYPNPVTEDLFIEIENSPLVREPPKVYNSQGQFVGKVEVERYHNHHSMQGRFAMQNYPAGIYFVRYPRDNRVIDVRVIKR